MVGHHVAILMSAVKALSASWVKCLGPDSMLRGSDFDWQTTQVVNFIITDALVNPLESVVGRSLLLTTRLEDKAVIKRSNCMQTRCVRPD